jgi:hypothetical protein
VDNSAGFFVFLGCIFAFNTRFYQRRKIKQAYIRIMNSNKLMLKRIPFVLLLFFGVDALAQTSAQSITFVDFQRTYPKINEVLLRKEDTLRKQFEAKGLAWPAKYIYIRSFKYDSQLEVWVKYRVNEKYKLFNTYKVCALAGSLGPKRMQGDYQVPEGFYYINEFNPRSMYHLSLGLKY